jgi:hypothetical protein
MSHAAEEATVYRGQELMTMIRALLLLLNLLTDYQALEALARDVFTFGLVNTGIACMLTGFAIVRRSKLRRSTTAPSRA